MNTLSFSAGFPEAGLLKASLKNTEPGVASTAPFSDLTSEQMPDNEQSYERAYERAYEGPYEEMDDHALMAATKVGDQLAFQELVQRYKNKLINFIYGL